MASDISERELGQLLNSVAGRVGSQVVAPVASADVRGYVASYDVPSRKAAIREGTRDTPPTPGWDVPAWLRLSVGDYVLARRLGSDRIVVMALDRNASIDAFDNPLTTPGQIIVMGADGPTVIEPPADPLLPHQLVWDPVLLRPVWEPV